VNAATERNILANENVPVYICTNEECPDFGERYRIGLDHEQVNCPTCKTEGKEWE
jgi:hypothetical protein